MGSKHSPARWWRDYDAEVESWERDRRHPAHWTIVVCDDHPDTPFRLYIGCHGHGGAGDFCGGSEE